MSKNWVQTFADLKAKYDGAPDLDSEYRERLTTETEFWNAAGDAEIGTDVKSALADNIRRIEEVEHSIKERNESRAARAKNDARRAALGVAAGPGSVPYGSGVSPPPAVGKSLGERLLADETFAAWLNEKFGSGKFTKANFGQSPAFDVKTLLTGDAASAGALIPAQVVTTPDPGAVMQPLTLRALLSPGKTGSNLVEYVRQGTFTNAAAVVPEATATDDDDALKPESAIAMSQESAPVVTIAHWIPATRSTLSDAGQLATLVNTLLLYGLEETLEDQILNGSGTGELEGIANVTGIGTQAFATDILTTSRKARTKVRTGGRAVPTAFVLNPADWEAFDLTMDGTDRYYFGGPSVLGAPRLWGLPVVECEAQAAGAGFVGDWRTGILYDREVGQILVTDSHSDFFVRNLVAILAESRAALAWNRPAALVSMALTAGP